MARDVLLQRAHRQLLQHQQTDGVCGSMRAALQRVEYLCSQLATYARVVRMCCMQWSTVLSCVLCAPLTVDQLPADASSTASEDSSLTGILVGSIVGGVVLIASIALIGFLVWRRRRRRALPDLPALKDMAVVRQLQGSGAFLSALLLGG